MVGCILTTIDKGTSARWKSREVLIIGQKLALDIASVFPKLAVGGAAFEGITVVPTSAFELQ